MLSTPQASVNKQPLNVAEVFPEINEITDQTLREAVIDVWQELWSKSSYAAYDDVPVSPEISYPTKPHNQCVLRMCLSVANEIERFHGVKVNRDHLIAAAILQDASKVVEYQTDAAGKTQFSDLGRQYPHAFMAAHIALLKGIPEPIVHVLLTHSPQAPKFPATLEGKILYYVDQLDVIAVFKDRWRKELFITK